MISVLFVSDADSRYGASKSLFQLVRELKANYADEISVTVVLSLASRKMKEPLEALGCTTVISLFAPYLQGIPYDKYKLPIKYIVRLVEYLWGRFFEKYRLRKIIDLNKIDIIHANSSREDFSAMISSKHNIPLVWHIREYGDLGCNCYSYRNDYIRLMNETADVLIAVSDAVREHWISKGVNPRKIRTIYNGVEYITPENISMHRLVNGKIRMVIVGSLSKTKGQEELIEAISLFNEKDRDRIHVDVIGDGPASYKNKLQNMICSFNLVDSVYICGYVKDIQLQLTHYDIGLTCSQAEGFGRTTAEYMMAGLATIVSDSGANAELVRDGQDGLIYSSGNLEDLRDKISIFLEHPDLVKKYGESARKRAVNMFTSQINAEHVYSVYKELLN